MQHYTANWDATEAQLARAMADLEAHALALGLSPRNALTLVLMLEELYTNTLRHGVGASRCIQERNALGNAPPVGTRIRVQLEILPDGDVALIYEDDAAPYDPFQLLHDQQLASTDLAVEDRPVGRLGAVLLARMSDSTSYVYQDDRNRITLRLNPNKRADS